jgi:hypothetical protein
MSRGRLALSVRSLALGLALAACGGASARLRLDHQGSRPEELQAVLERLRTAPPREEPAIILGLTPAPSRLWVWSPASGRLAWQTEIEPETVPHVAGRWVVTQERNEIVVRRLEDGAITARFADADLALLGADGDREAAAIVLSTGGGVGARSLLYGLHRGAVAWRIEGEQAFGRPAVRAGMIFLPWAQQHLSVLDADTGSEITRIHFTRGVVGHALAREHDIFFGQRGISRLSERSGPSPEAAWFEPARRELPGSPELLRDAYRPPPAPSSATHRVRLAWSPVAEGEHGAALLDDTMYLVFYRLIFALPASGDGVRWVAQVPGDVVGVSVERGGLLVVDEQGRVHSLHRSDGRVSLVHETGLPTIWAHISDPDHDPGSSDSVLPLRDRLLAAAQNTDARLVPARAYAVRLLASLPEPEVTESLITLCDDDALPEPLRTVSCDALASRRTGMEHVLAALERHASYLRGTRAPPVGALARAAAGAGARSAVPLLLAHLRDPQTRVQDLAALAEALRALGARSAADPLGDFVRLYHAEPESDGMGPGLAAAIEAYAALAGPASQDLLRKVIDDPMSMAPAREAAQRALAALTAPPPTPSPAEATGGAPAVADAQGPPADAPRPARMTLAIVRQVLAPIDADLRACLVQPGRAFPQARVVLAIEPSGALHTVSVHPADLQSCLEPLIRSRTFPATRSPRRETIAHVIGR